MACDNGTNIEPIDHHLTAAGRMYEDSDNTSNHPSCDEEIECNCITCKEELTYDDLCVLECLIGYFNHEASLDKEIAILKEECLLSTINSLEGQLKSAEHQLTLYMFNEDKKVPKLTDVLTLMFYVKSDKVPEAKVDDLIANAFNNPMSLLEYIDEADKRKYDVNMMQYVKDVEGEW